MHGWVQVLYVPLPSPSGRVSILRALTRKTPLAPDVDLAAVGTHPAAGDYSGADLAALVREACVLALKVHDVMNGCLLQLCIWEYRINAPCSMVLRQRRPEIAACLLRGEHTASDTQR